MFRKRESKPVSAVPPTPLERVTTVLGSGTIWKGSLSGSGGVRIEGSFEGEIALRGMLVVGATGRVTCPHLRANVIIIAGAVRGDITSERVEIRSSGRVWGDVVTAAFSTEEGAFLRGQIRMEEKVEIGVAVPEKAALEAPPAASAELNQASQTSASPELPQPEPPAVSPEHMPPIEPGSENSLSGPLPNYEDAADEQETTTADTTLPTQISLPDEPSDPAIHS